MNLAVSDILDHHSRLIEQIKFIMKKLRGPVSSAKLRNLVRLKAILSKVTRWSSVCAMLERYKKLRPFLNDVAVADIKLLVLNTVHDNAIDSLSDKLSDLNTVTKALQEDTCNMGEVRLLFNEIISDYPSAKKYLDTDSNIVRCPQFESAIAKI